MISKYSMVKENLIEMPKTWLITGVAGFIGSNLLELLLRLGQKIIGLDNFSTGHKRNIDEVLCNISAEGAMNFKFIDGDIRELETCKAACEGVDIVLHQAALGSVPRSLNCPITTNQNNIDGFLNMLVAARDQRVERFVYAASSSTYGDSVSLPKVEEIIGRPLSPYAVTKYVNELYADVFRTCYGLECVGLRYFNVFGRRQDAYGDYAAVIPRWFKGIINNETIYINGDGTTSRDFCYVDNVVQANILAGCCDGDAVGSVYNVACGSSTSLTELYNIIRRLVVKKVIGIEDEKIEYKEFRKGDIRHSLADISKAKRYLGYCPTHSVQEGLEEASEWYIK